MGRPGWILFWNDDIWTDIRWRIIQHNIPGRVWFEQTDNSVGYGITE